MDANESMLLKAVAEVVKDHLAVKPMIRDVTISGRDLPTPQVFNEVQSPEVHVKVDMTPVAEAIDRLTVGMKEIADMQSKAMEEHVKLITKMAKAFSSMPAPVVEMNPVINVPETKIPAPIIRVEVPKPSKRSFTIHHSEDGDSTVTEE